MHTIAVHRYLATQTTANREVFVVRILSDSMGNAKIKHMKIMCIINANAVRGCLPENYLISSTHIA